MSTVEISGDAFISKMEVRLGLEYTDEQHALVKAFHKPTICFASPGTGKTATAIGGLFYTELYDHVPGENIYALSFTNLATGELCVRHKKACTNLHVPVQTPKFQTLHSLCRTILVENYHLLGMSKLDTSGTMSLKNSVRLVEDLARDMQKPVTPQIARNIVKAIRELNSSMIFDEDHVKTKKCFKDTRVDYEVFTKLRKSMFAYCTLSEVIPVDNIMLYTLDLMTKHPEVSKAFKEKCKVMLVDEAQDLSLLHLRIISLMTDCPILIGDMKQQIYAFNGACQEIVQQFYRLYPDAETLELNQSFRCKNEIIDYANKIIEHNGLGNNNVKGTSDGGSVQIVTGLSLNDLAARIAKEYEDNNRLFPRNTMFLFRNNASSIPVVEAMYQHQVPVLVNKYKPATEIPVIQELCELLNLCRNPYNINYVQALAYLIPELRTFTNLTDNPFYKMMKGSVASIFEVNYLFKDMGVGSAAMQALSHASEMMKQGALVKELFNSLWEIYYKQWVHPREWMLEYTPKYYINLVQDLVRNKTFDKFISDEAAKKKFVDECSQKSLGVRAYTMHAAKGLEADDVYILDADEGIIPNLGKLDQLVKADCNMDAAREIRNERALCYVAITRAKDNVYIVHNGMPASMIMGDNQFESFDTMYETLKLTSDDILAFESFVRSA